MADEKIRYVLDVDDKGTPKLVKFGQAADKSGKQAEKSFGGMGQKLQDVGGQIPQIGGAMSALSGGPMVAVAAGAAAIVGGFAMLTKSAIDFADGLNDMSDRTGLAIETLSSLSLVSELGGTSLESVAQILGKFSSKVAEGDKNVKSLNLTSKDSASAMIEIADRVKNAKTQTEAISIAQRAYGKQWQEMMPILKMGGEEINRIMATTPRVTAEMAQAAARFNDSMAVMKTQVQGVGLGIAEWILPHLQDWLDGINEIRIAFGMLTAEETRSKGRQEIIDQYNELIEVRKKAVASGAMTERDFKGKAIKIDDKTLQQRLAEYDAETEKLAKRIETPNLGGEAGVVGAAKGPAFDPTFELGPAGKQYFGADADKAAAAFAERQKKETVERLAGYEAENRATADLSKRLTDNAIEIAQADKAKIEAIEKEKAAKEELRQINIDMAEESLKLLKQERDAYEKNLSQQLGMNNGALTEMIRGKQSFAETSAQIDDTMKNYAIQKGLEFVEQWIAQQITMMLFGDAVKAAEAAKAVALGATQAAAYAPAAALASTASFGGAAVAGGAALAAVLASFAFADRGSSTLQGGRRMIVGENRAEEFRPTVPGNIHNNTTNYGAVNVTVQGGGDARAIAREIVRAQRMAGANNYGGSH